MTAGSIHLVAPEAEERLLAACLGSTAALMAAIGSGLRPEDFGSPGHEHIYRAMRDMMDRGQSVDNTTLTGLLETSGKLELLGGKGVIDRLASLGEYSHNAKEYSDIIRDRSIRRSLFDATEEIVNKIHSVSDTRELITGSENLVYRVADKLSGGAKSGITMAELVEVYSHRNAEVERIVYPLAGLNEYTRGRGRGSLTVWGGYTSDGKTIMGMQSALAAAMSGKSVGFFSLEMTEEELLYRLLSMLSGVASYKVQTGDMDMDEMLLVDQAVHTLSQLDIKTYHDPDYTMAEIRSIQQRDPYDLVIIDYLQRLPWTKYQDIPAIAKQCKNMALQTKCCVDLLSQLMPASVKPGQNQFPPPTLNSFFGGKATAHEADNAVFIYAHREQVIDSKQPQWVRTNTGQIISGKQRGGKAEFEFDVTFNETRIMWEEDAVDNLLHLPTKIQGR